jgi:Tol biopolymer transport system component
MKGSIWRLKLGEATAYELNTSRGYPSQPAWSPDGRWMAYTSGLDGYHGSPESTVA